MNMNTSTFQKKKLLVHSFQVVKLEISSTLCTEDKRFNAAHTVRIIVVCMLQQRLC